MLAHEINVLWAPTHSPSLTFCSSLGKDKPEPMQEIWDNTSVDPCSNIPNKSMWPYLAVPTYLMELLQNFFNLSWAVERWNLSSVFLLLSLFLKSIGENMVTTIIWFLNLSTRALFLVCVSKPRLNKCSFSSNPLKAKYVELIGKEKVMRTSVLQLQSFLPLRYLALSHDHEHNN
jgi:hypothetical protein